MYCLGRSLNDKMTDMCKCDILFASSGYPIVALAERRNFDLRPNKFRSSIAPGVEAVKIQTNLLY